MNAKMNKSDFYTKKARKINLKKYYSNNTILNKKLDILQEDLKKGFTLYKGRYLERFLKADDIDDYGQQMVLIYEFYKTHNKLSNSEEQYKLLYGEKLGKERWEKGIERVTGKNNPAYGNEGKYSPWKKGSINYSKDAIRKAQENRSYNTRIDYYLNKGYSLEESAILLKERQSTNRLSKFIERYGEDEGLKKWILRQQRWQNTLKSKSKEEIDDINRRKSSGIGRYLDRNIPGKLYYIHFFNDTFSFWKIGITSNSLNERFNLDLFEIKHNLKYNVEFINEYDTIQEAYDKEQYILAVFNDSRITVDYNGFYTTESFNNNILEDFYEVI